MVKYMVNLEILLSHVATILEDSGYPLLYHNYTRHFYLPKHMDDSEFNRNDIIGITHNIYIYL